MARSPVTLEFVGDTTRLELQMLTIAKHLQACADELRAVRLSTNDTAPPAPTLNE